MKTTNKSPRKHRTPQQWQSIVDQYLESGLSGKRFCTDRGIGYASFCKWRQRLAEHSDADSENATPAFIDLGALDAQSEAEWNIVLKLGNGVELCLSQARVRP